MPEHASSATDAEANIVRRWSGRVPIVIGAIGHRNIRPADGKLAAALRAKCRKLKRLYNSSPFVILPPLAEGARRLIAKTAMEELGADLIALLPMPEADHGHDFKTGDSKTRYARKPGKTGVHVARNHIVAIWATDRLGRNRNRVYRGSKPASSIPQPRRRRENLTLSEARTSLEPTNRFQCTK